MKALYVKDIKTNDNINSTFMIKKKLSSPDGNTLAYVGDKTGDIKVSIPSAEGTFSVGDVILIIGKQQDRDLKIKEVVKQTQFDINDYLPAVKRPIADIMGELEKISDEEFKSNECKNLNDFFFKNEKFLNKFIHGIGGLSQHHAYIGGLAEHTLNVMYMAKVMAYRYDCSHKEIAILSAKLHDIGKIEEYNTNGPFSVTMRGEMEGHIVIGINMLEEAFKAGGNIYSEDFKSRIKGCIVQHHGKVEYGSPKAPNTQEAFIVHYADYVDATLNKITTIKETIEPGNWSEYDRRIGTRILV